MDRLLEATRRAEQRHFWFRGFRAFVRPLIADAVAGLPSARILDCGCGTGANLVMLGEYGRSYGFDISWDGLQFARDYGQAAIAHASITHIPFRDASFDVVTAFDVLYSLSEEQEVAAVEEDLPRSPSWRFPHRQRRRSEDPSRQSFGLRRRAPPLHASPVARASLWARLRRPATHVYQLCAFPSDACRAHRPTRHGSRDAGREWRRHRRAGDGIERDPFCDAGARSDGITAYRHADRQLPPVRRAPPASGLGAAP